MARLLRASRASSATPQGAVHATHHSTKAGLRAANATAEAPASPRIRAALARSFPTEGAGEDMELTTRRATGRLVGAEGYTELTPRQSGLASSLHTEGAGADPQWTVKLKPRQVMLNSNLRMEGGLAEKGDATLTPRRSALASSLHGRVCWVWDGTRS